MRDNNRYVRTLQRALELAGSEDELAKMLRTSRDVLSLWLSGQIAPPMKAYMAALELVTRNVAQNRRVQ